MHRETGFDVPRQDHIAFAGAEMCLAVRAGDFVTGYDFFLQTIGMQLYTNVAGA